MKIFAAAIIAACSATLVQAQEITSVAVSPDGTTIKAAGTNRVVYTVDAETMQITDRHYHPGKVEEIQYTPDGRRIIMRMDNEMVRVVSARSLKNLYEISDVDEMSLSADGSRLALLENSYKGGILSLVNAANGKPISRIEFPEIRTRVVGLSADGSKAIVLSQGDNDGDLEPKESTPSDLDDYAEDLFKQQHDGYVSKVIAVDFSDDSHTVNQTFFRSSFPFAVGMVGDKLAVTNGTQDSALIAADGSTELMNFGDLYLSNAMLSADASTVMMNNGSTFMVHGLDGSVIGAEQRKIEGPRIDGPGEWITAMDEAADGTIYVATSAYRLWKIAPDASEPEVIPVY